MSAARWRVYTDGSCAGPGQPGGWAWVMQADGDCASGYEAATTNQRMELRAALEAVLHHETPITVVSDSAYVVNCFIQGWWRKWEREDYDDIKNTDLWKPLVAAARERSTVFEKVKGHSGDVMNDRADALAREARLGGPQ